MAAKKTPPAPEPGDALSFEQALERLETIVEELEGGALTLVDSIARYEEGVKLSRYLGRTLDHAEKRIERLVSDGDGTPSTETMELDDESPASETDPRPPSAPGRRVTRTPDEGPGELPF